MEDELGACVGCGGGPTIFFPSDPHSSDQPSESIPASYNALLEAQMVAEVFFSFLLAGHSVLAGHPNLGFSVVLDQHL